MKFSMKYCL